MVTAIKPWYTYPMDSPGGGYGEGIDPVCGGGKYCSYLKPDTNLAIPPGVPITALLPMTVTDVSSRGSGDGGLSVTGKLDNPLNGLAQYISYNFLGSAGVSVGQHLSPGDQLGVSGSPTGIDFALGLGPSPSWGSGSFPQGSGNPLTDPRQVLKSILNGLPLPTGTGTGTGTQSIGITDCGNITDPNFIPCQMDNWIVSTVEGWLQSDSARAFLLIIVALIIGIIGIIVLFKSES